MAAACYLKNALAAYTSRNHLWRYQAGYTRIRGRSVVGLWCPMPLEEILCQDRTVADACGLPHALQNGCAGRSLRNQLLQYDCYCIISTHYSQSKSRSSPAGHCGSMSSSRMCVLTTTFYHYGHINVRLLQPQKPCESAAILQDIDLMANTALPEDLGSMGGRSYTHDVLQGRCAGIGVEENTKHAWKCCKIARFYRHLG